MKVWQFRKAIPVLACTVFTVVSGLASPIFVSNFSFETLPPGGLPNACGTGCFFNSGVVQGWTVSAQTAIVGQFQPGPSSGNFNSFNFIPDGITIAYSDGGIISQVVPDLVVEGNVYTLQVEKGVRPDRGDTGTITLLIGTTPIIATGIAASQGNWSTYTATYTAIAGDANKPITIQLSAASGQGDWDNVRLDASTVPEPGTLLLLGAGLIGLAAGARRFRRA